MSKWFDIERPKPHALMRIFCFPYAGGGASVFRQWSEELPSNVEVISVRLPGRETRIDESPIASLDQLLKSLYQNIIPFCNKPFMFFGHSNGALICYELALLMRRRELETLPITLVLSAKIPPHVPGDDKKRSILSDDEFIFELKELNGTPKELLENRELMEMLLPMIRADFSLTEGHIFQKDIILDCPVSVFYGSEDNISKQQIMAWQDLFREQVNFYEFTGGHFFIHEQRAEVLSVLNSVIKKIIKDNK